MSIHKDNATGKWRVVYRYTDWTGETHQSSKRGFSTKREAQMWERELLLKKEAKLDMTFEIRKNFSSGNIRLRSPGIITNSILHILHINLIKAFESHVQFGFFLQQ